MPLSDEQRKASSDRMKARHAAKRAEISSIEEAVPTKSAHELELEAEIARLKRIAEDRTPSTVVVDEKTDGVSEEEYRALLNRVLELESAGFRSQQSPGGPQVNPRGALVGTYDKYSMDFDDYEDPTKRLASEPKLLRVPFKSRAEAFGGHYEYDLIFEIMLVQYETKAGVNTQEPRFTLKLNRFLPDPETDEATNEAYTACQLVFHEDPQAALVIARDNNITVDRTNEKLFLNEMRYLRMRDWLMDSFYQPKRKAEKKTREMVVGNKLVTIFEVASDAGASEKFDFSKLKNKL